MPEFDFHFADPGVPVAAIITCARQGMARGKHFWLTRISLSFGDELDIEDAFVQEFSGGFLDRDDWTTNRPSLFAAKFVSALKEYGISYNEKTKAWCEALNSELARAIERGRKSRISASRLMLRTVRVESFGPERLDVHLGLDTPYRLAGEGFSKPRFFNLFLKQRLTNYKPIDEGTYDTLLSFWREKAIQRPIEEDPLAALLIGTLVQRVERAGIYQGFGGGTYDTISNTDQAATLFDDGLFITSALFNQVLREIMLNRGTAMVLLTPYLASTKYEARHVRKEGRRDISRTFLKLSWKAMLREYPELAGALRGPSTDKDQTEKITLGDLIDGEITGSINGGLAFVNGMPALLCSDDGVLHFHVDTLEKQDNCGGLFFQIEAGTCLLIREGDGNSMLPFSEIIKRDLVRSIFIEQPEKSDQNE